MDREGGHAAPLLRMDTASVGTPPQEGNGSGHHVCPYFLLRHTDHRARGARGAGEAREPHAVLPGVTLQDRGIQGSAVEGRFSTQSWGGVPGGRPRL